MSCKEAQYKAISQTSTVSGNLSRLEAEKNEPGRTMKILKFGILCTSLLATLISLSCSVKPRGSGLPGDVASDSSIIPCVGMVDDAECGAAIYHTRHLSLVKNEMGSQEVMAIMFSPTVVVGGGAASSLCYSVVFGPKELKCIELSNDVVTSISDCNYSEVPGQ